MTELDRRTLLKGGAAAVGGLALGFQPSSTAAATGDRPNVLWLVSEDNNPYIGAYGDPLARTPTIDRLAAEGVRYERFFAPAPVCAPTRFGIITGMYASSVGPAHHMRADGNIPAWLRGFPAFLREAGYWCSNNRKTDYNAPIRIHDAWDQSSNRAHWRNRAPGQPFFSVFNHNVTHESSLHGDFEPLPDGVDPADVRLPAYHPDRPEMRADRALYYDQMTRLDGQLATRLAELTADGLDEDTIVFYYSDHGGTLARSKRYCYDSGLHSPLIIRVPEKWRHLLPHPPGSVVTDPVSHIDLAPTMLSLLGQPVPDYMEGQAFAGPKAEPPRQYVVSFRNRIDERYDCTRTIRDQRFRYIRNWMPHLPYGQHQVFFWRQTGVQVWEQAYRNGELNAVQSAFWQDKAVEELYDLDNDPDEVNNLAGQPECKDVVERLRRALETHIITTRDNGFLPESSPLEGYRQGIPEGDYPVARVLRVADVAAQRDPANLPSLLEWLADDAEPVRWWAALGCVMLREGAAPARDALIGRLADPSPPVRVAAAEALCHISETTRGLPVLEQLLAEHPNERVRLQAVNSLDHLGDLAAPALETIEAARTDPDRQVRWVADYAAARLSAAATA